MYPAKQSETNTSKPTTSSSSTDATKTESDGTSTIAEVYQLYSDNIQELTPLISDVLSDTINEYTAEWVADAIKETALMNKYSMKYILAILKNWSEYGKDSDLAKSQTNKYVTGRYGRYVES